MIGGNVKIVLEAQFDKLRKGLKAVEKDVQGFAGKFRKSLNIAKVAETALGFGVANAAMKATAAMKDFVVESSQAAIQFQTTYKAFTNMVGSDSELLLRRMDDAAKGTVASLDLVANANRAMLLGIDKNALPEMMEISRTIALASGKDINFMFESLSMGIGRQSRMLLDNLGIIVNADEAYKKYAFEMGIVGRELTGLERNQAFTNETMRKGIERTEAIGDVSGGAAEAMMRYKASVTDLKTEWGELTLTPLTILFEGLSKGMDEITTKTKAATGEFGSLAAAIMLVTPGPLKGITAGYFEDKYVSDLESQAGGPEGEGLGGTVGWSEEQLQMFTDLDIARQLETATMQEAIEMLLLKKEALATASEMEQESAEQIMLKAEALADANDEIYNVITAVDLFDAGMGKIVDGLTKVEQKARDFSDFAAGSKGTSRAEFEKKQSAQQSEMGIDYGYQSVTGRDASDPREREAVRLKKEREKKERQRELEAGNTF